MTPLDQALEAARTNSDARSDFYELFLNSQLYIPTQEAPAAGQPEKVEAGEAIQPLIAQADGKDYLLLFDSQERLTAWAERPMPFICLPGIAIAEMSPASLNWALNIGTDHAREFEAQEVAWLKEVVEQMQEQGADEEDGEDGYDEEE